MLWMDSVTQLREKEGKWQDSMKALRRDQNGQWGMASRASPHRDDQGIKKKIKV